MYKRILIVALNEFWPGISRLPSGLSRAGFETYAVCPKKSYLSKTRHLKGGLFYPTFSYSRSKMIYFVIYFAILFYGPDLIVPGDEDSILALHRLANFLDKVPFLKRTALLIRGSLTPKEFDEVILNKSKLQELCQKLGVRVPQNFIVKGSREAIERAQVLGYPVVLKFDSGYGGSGVFICNDEQELLRHFGQIKKSDLKSRLKYVLKRIFFVSVLSEGQNISIQQWIKGQVGQTPFCAKDGKVFAMNPMIRLETFPGKTGPATVSAGLLNKDTAEFVTRIAARLRYNGFGSVEYIVEEKSSLIYVIELNPRPTPTCHISDDVVPNDLSCAFFKGINRQPVNNNPYRPFTIAMFPGEKRRDPNSQYFASAYHDVPKDDPLLLAALDK